MPYIPPSQQRHIPKRLAPREVLGAMLAHTPTPEAQARVQAMAARLGVEEEPRPQPRRITRAERQRQQAYAMEAETRGRKEIGEEGYRVTQSDGSRTAADFLATKIDDATLGPLVRHVQMKWTAAMEPTIANDGVRRFLGLGVWAKHGPYRLASGASRELWVWEYDRGWAVKLTVNPDGSVTCTDGPWKEVVQAAIDRMLPRSGQSNRPPETQSFRERLQV